MSEIYKLNRIEKEVREMLKKENRPKSQEMLNFLEWIIEVIED